MSRAFLTIFTVVILTGFIGASSSEALSIAPCTAEYAPVCGFNIRLSQTARCITPNCFNATYPNMCQLNRAGALFLYWGECISSGVITPNYNKPPVINSFTGPTVLYVGQAGTWKIQATDPENGTLTYNIKWGDESVLAYPQTTSAFSGAFVQNTTFEHSYSQPGTYVVTITVKDDVGNTIKSSATVRVINKYPQQPNPWQYYWNYYYDYDYGYNDHYGDYYGNQNWYWWWQNPYGWNYW